MPHKPKNKRYSSLYYSVLPSSNFNKEFEYHSNLFSSSLNKKLFTFPTSVTIFFLQIQLLAPSRIHLCVVIPMKKRVLLSSNGQEEVDKQRHQEPDPDSIIHPEHHQVGRSFQTNCFLNDCFLIEIVYLASHSLNASLSFSFSLKHS